MLRRSWQKDNRKKGQIFLEYTMVITVIILVLFAMNTMIKRGIQGMIKVVADQIGHQVNAEQPNDERGLLENSYMSTRAIYDKTTSQTPGVGVATIVYTYADEVFMDQNATVNLGFTEE